MEMPVVAGTSADANEEKRRTGVGIWKFRRRLERNGGGEDAGATRRLGMVCQSLSGRSGGPAQFLERGGWCSA